MFELLSNLNPTLPCFGRENWQSRIRHHATIHPEYSDLTVFAGRETSDIVYDDASGILTELLITKGHLSNTHWAGKTPRYYIEVKSTLDRCETPFYVSDDQAERVSGQLSRFLVRVTAVSMLTLLLPRCAGQRTVTLVVIINTKSTPFSGSLIWD